MTLNERNSLIAGLKKALLVFGIFIGLLLLALTIFYFWGSSGTLPQEKLSEIIVYSDSTAEPRAETETFTVMTYNIGYLSGMFNNLPVKTGKSLFENNMKEFLELVKKIQPDVIGFQEIDFNSRRSFYINQLETIAENAGYKYGAVAINWDKRYVPFPYWPPSVHFGKMLSGQAVLSRRPILSTKRVVLEKPANTPFYYNAFYLDRLVQMVKIQIKERVLIVLNVHLEAFDGETREKQVKVVLNIYRSYKDDYPVLLMGDFNCAPPNAPQKKNFVDEPETDFSNEKTIQLLLGENSLKAADLMTFTFPTDNPTHKLDYIFYNHEKMTLINAFVPQIDSSDHLPVVIAFTLFAGPR